MHLMKSYSVFMTLHHTLGQVISFVSGGLLIVVAVSSIFLGHSLAVTWEHPYSVGTVATGVSWVAYGLFGSQQRMSYWLGTASNGLVRCEGASWADLGEL